MSKFQITLKFKNSTLEDKSNNNFRKDNLKYKIVTFAIGIILFANIIIFQDIDAVTETTDTSNNYSLSKLFNQVQQSVVQISSSEENISKQLGFRLGSGFVYDKNGHIITNNHVVIGSSELLVTFPDGSIYKGQLIGSDPHSDIAVVKVNTVPQEKLIPLVIGNSSKLVIGQPVAAVGNPFGLSGSMTEGIVSGLGRLLPSLPSEPETLFGTERSTAIG
ncbi:MAG TPA: trypsin-like peptidase domain-containing protein, partial [Nitrososphaeraceae archaeon]|nr:trypsin-like peptidase domain-containing protein [Nitrososphaeraceae archaeon]